MSLPTRKQSIRRRLTAPKHITIGPLTFTVKHVSFYANIRFSQNDILIDPEQHIHHQRMTLLHEVLHGCFHVTMLDKKWEETAVRLLTGPLLDTLRRNPDLVAFLLAIDEAPADA